MEINIIGVNFLEAYLHDELVVHFKISSGNLDEHKIRVRVEDPFFGTDFFIGPTSINCRDGILFWASFRIRDIMKDPTLGFSGGVVIIFEEEESGKEIYRRKFLNKGISFEKRALSSESDYDSPRLFILGDSHSWTNFGQFHENINKVGNYTLVRHVIYKVSSFSFWSGDYNNFIGLLPIEEKDILMFNFGTFDFRKGCFKLSKKRNIPIKEIIYQTIFQTFYKIIELRKRYPKNHVIISSIVPPIREVFFGEQERFDYLNGSTDQERLEIYNTYLEFWSRQAKFLENASFLDWTTKYKDEDGFCKENLLRPGDFHIGDFRPALKSLEEHLNKLKQID